MACLAAQMELNDSSRVVHPLPEAVHSNPFMPPHPYLLVATHGAIVSKCGNMI